MMIRKGIRSAGKAWLATVVLLTASPSFAAGYTTWAVPTRVELVSDGVLIAGAFGDPSGCGEPDYIFVRSSHGRFKEIVAMAYSALIAGRQLQFYASSCAVVGFHWSGAVINESRDQMASIR